jgi:hypothetical protein
LLRHEHELFIGPEGSGRYRQLFARLFSAPAIAEFASQDALVDRSAAASIQFAAENWNPAAAIYFKG